MATRQEKIDAYSAIAGNVLGVGLMFLLAWIFNISADKEYGWIAGFFHGGWAPCNWIRSLFFNGVYVKAPLHTSAYNWFWWISLIVVGLWTWFGFIVGVISAIRNAIRKLK